MLGPTTYAEQPSPYLGDVVALQSQWRGYSERVAGEIDATVQVLVSDALDQATKILSSNRKVLHETAEKLLQRETLSGDQIPMPVWPQPGKDRHVRGI